MSIDALIDDEVQAYRTRLSCLRPLEFTEASAGVRLCRTATESILEFVETRPRPRASTNWELDEINAKLERLPAVLAAQLIQSKDDGDGIARLRDTVLSAQAVCSAHAQRAVDAAERVPALTSERLTPRFEALSSQLSELTVRNAKSVVKGAENERRFVEALIEHLARSRHARLRDAVVEHCSGASRSCDVVVRCKGMPAVRIELKTYANPVPTSEVAKFYRDLETIGTDHGLCISTDSRIVGKDPFATERISVAATRTRYAMFLPDNGHDMACVESALEILWLLGGLEKEDTVEAEEEEQEEESEDGWLRVSPARYDQVRRIVDEHSEIFKSASHHADAIKRVLKRACLRDILRALEDQDVEEEITNERPRQICPGCRRTFVNLNNHKCRRLPTIS